MNSQQRIRTIYYRLSQILTNKILRALNNMNKLTLMILIILDLKIKRRNEKYI